MVCGKCGANLPDGVQFCTVCGNSMDAKPAAPVQPNYYAPAVKSSGVSVFGIILMIVGAIVGAYWIAEVIYGLVTAASYSYSSVDFWTVANLLFNGISPGLILVGVGAVLNKLARR